MTQTAEPHDLTVSLGARSYRIEIGSGTIDTAGARIAPLLARSKTVVVTDANVAALHLDRLRAALTAEGIEAPAIVLPPGERTKTFADLARLTERLAGFKLERRDTLIAFGGGVIGDLAGFAAAIYMRGMAFVQIPTTLLAQVDSSVGGKTGIDLPQGKNLAGAFHQPAHVLIDTDLLATLPDRQMRAGHAEILKYGALGDGAFFGWLEREGARVLARAPDALAHAVRRSCEMKAGIVAEDETEAGRRALLNLGHTFGHAFEAELGFSDDLLHGEAVALGLCLAARLSAALGHCPPEDAARLAATVAAAGLPARLSDLPGETPSASRLLAHMTSDKKVSDGRIALILLSGLGRAFVTREVAPATIEAFLKDEGAR